MTRDTLRSMLEQENVSPEAYSLDNGMPIERYVLSREPDGRWAVYYSERGLRQGLEFFTSESEACGRLYGLLIKDPTTRRRAEGKAEPKRPDW